MTRFKQPSKPTILESPNDGTVLTTMASYVTIMSALLPYIKSSPLGTDLQPHFFVLFFGFFLWTRPKSSLKDRRIPIALWIGSAYSIVLMVMSDYVYAVAFFVIPVFVVLLAREKRVVLDRCVKLAIFVYGLGCLLEMAGFNVVLDGVLASSRGSDIRGLQSFTNEPSYLALVGLAMCTYLLWRRASIFWISAGVALVLASGSLTGILPLAVVGILFSITHFSTKVIFSVLFFVGILSASASFLIDPDSRLYDLSSELFNDPTNAFKDVSVSNRLVRSIGPIYLAYQDSFLPHSYSNGDYLFVHWSGLAANSQLYTNQLSNIASVATYVLGFLILPLLLLFFLSARGPIYIWFAAVYLTITNVSPATPYVCIVFALLYVSRSTNREPAITEVVSPTSIQRRGSKVSRRQYRTIPAKSMRRSNNGRTGHNADRTPNISATIQA